MNNNPNIGTGYLIVKVSTARGAIPLEGAAVNIRGAAADNSDIIYSLRTNRDGATERVTLPTPAKLLSQSPDNLQPYALYSIDVFKEGYSDIVLESVAVFDSITSIQPAVMIPLAANNYPDSYERTSSRAPSDNDSSLRGGE